MASRQQEPDLRFSPQERSVGYQDTTIKQLVSLAGVSRSSFYKHFEDKEACFLATLDLIVEMANERIGRAYRSQTDWQAQMRASFRCFAEIVAQEPDAAHLVLADALGAGRRALTHREAAIHVFETMLAQSFARAPKPAIVSETTIQVIVAGIRRVAYRRLLAGEPEKLIELTEDLFAWAISYHAPGVTPPERPPIPKHTKRTRNAPTQPVLLPPDPDQAGEQSSSRQRILDAVTSIAIEHGYQALSMPTIAKQAGASNETFYQHFKNKQDAFLAAFSENTQHAIALSIQAFGAAEVAAQAPVSA